MPNNPGSDTTPVGSTSAGVPGIVKITDIVKSLGEVSEGVTARTRALVHDIAGEVPPFHTPPSWMEWFGARMAGRILFFIGVLVGLFVVI